MRKKIKHKEEKTKKRYPLNVQSPVEVAEENKYYRIKNKTTSQQIQIPGNFEMTEDFLKAFDCMENTNKHVYITGDAGTGKSTLIQYFIQNTKKNVVVLAPTGVAAVNIGGSTIHSFFRLPPRLLTQNDIRKVYGSDDLFSCLDAVIIDEVSMVRADLMDAIDYSLRVNRSKHIIPFGGVQMILVGDLNQLPPVVEDENFMKHYVNTYRSPYFFDAKVFNQIRLEKIELRNIFRQSDPKFLELLAKIRKNQVTMSDLEILNQRHTEKIKYDSDEIIITLTSTNNLADKINRARLANISSPEYTFIAEIEGNFDEKSFPTNQYLQLKEGAQVMMIRNDPKRRWVNGTLGIVKKLSADTVKVQINGNEYDVEPTLWEKIEYVYDRSENRIEIITTGTFRQYPVKLAWAITIHKSQGKTFDKVVIDLGYGAFAHGQTYVALSRCRSLEGIYLKKEIKPQDLIFDSRINEFMNEAPLFNDEKDDSYSSNL